MDVRKKKADDEIGVSFDVCNHVTRRLVRALIAAIPDGCGLMSVDTRTETEDMGAVLTLALRVHVPRGYRPTAVEEMEDAVDGQ